mmetsp:Transcript_17881/g.53832  ORF Transcript_17881/g.53832 Transcript_17881/m.53832 type:complete len:208 (+) Transcript_17881:116-739(+)
MPVKRGLSLEEKRAKLLEVFHETKDVFVLKDIEKLGSKKGIVSQSIPEVLQSLCDDDLVHKERIGASNYFWSFPGEAAAKLESAVARAKEQGEALRAEEQSFRTQLGASLAAQPDAAKLAPKVQELKELEARKAKAKAALEQYAECDPDRFRALETGSQTAREHANVWLDNIECLRGFLKKQNEGRGDDIDDFFQQQGVSKDMDWLD